MPHIKVLLWPGKPEEKKQELAARIVKDVMETIGSKESSISVAFEEILPERWQEEVYKPEIIGKAETLYKKPGYNYDDSPL